MTERWGCFLVFPRLFVHIPPFFSCSSHLICPSYAPLFSTERSLRLIFLEQDILPNLLLLSLITEEMLRMPWTAEMAIDLTVVDWELSWREREETDGTETETDEGEVALEAEETETEATEAEVPDLLELATEPSSPTCLAVLPGKTWKTSVEQQEEMWLSQMWTDKRGRAMSISTRETTCTEL